VIVTSFVSLHLQCVNRFNGNAHGWVIVNTNMNSTMVMNNNNNNINNNNNTPKRQICLI